MLKIGEFIYPWGSGHYSRMMRLNDVLGDHIKEKFEVHYSSKDHVYEKLLKKFPDQKEKIHEILMPTPIDGKFGPSVLKSLMNLLLPVSKNPSLVKQITNYLREERKLYNKEKFDLVINDGDMGSNILAKNRNIPSLFVTNQFRPKLYNSRSYLYPSLIFVAKQIAKASKILVADSPPPYTMCEYNLNFIKGIEEKITYVGHFTNSKQIKKEDSSDLEKLVKDNEFGYWMRTGNKSTNDGTGQRYEKVFHQDEMKDEKRIISHAKNDSNIDTVLGKDGKKYSVSEALDKKIDWIQIDIGFLSEQEKDTILNLCKYTVSFLFSLASWSFYGISFMIIAMGTGFVINAFDSIMAVMGANAIGNLPITIGGSGLAEFGIIAYINNLDPFAFEITEGIVAWDAVIGWRIATYYVPIVITWLLLVKLALSRISKPQAT